MIKNKLSAEADVAVCWVCSRKQHAAPPPTAAEEGGRVQSYGRAGTGQKQTAAMREDLETHRVALAEK